MLSDGECDGSSFNCGGVQDKKMDISRTKKKYTNRIS